MEGLRFDSKGLIPAVCQDKNTGDVLMVAWMNDAALRHTLESREAHFWKVLPEGPACHTGEQSCFFREVGEGNR